MKTTHISLKGSLRQPVIDEGPSSHIPSHFWTFASQPAVAFDFIRCHMPVAFNHDHIGLGPSTRHVAKPKQLEISTTRELEAAGREAFYTVSQVRSGSFNPKDRPASFGSGISDGLRRRWRCMECLREVDGFKADDSSAYVKLPR